MNAISVPSYHSRSGFRGARCGGLRITATILHAGPQALRTRSVRRASGLLERAFGEITMPSISRSGVPPAATSRAFVGGKGISHQQSYGRVQTPVLSVSPTRLL